MCYTHSSKCRISSETNDKALNAITQLIYFPAVPKCFPGAEKLSCQNSQGFCCQPQEDSSALHHLSYSCWVSTLNVPSLRVPSSGGERGAVLLLAQLRRSNFSLFTEEVSAGAPPSASASCLSCVPSLLRATCCTFMSVELHKSELGVISHSNTLPVLKAQGHPTLGKGREDTSVFTHT